MVTLFVDLNATGSNDGSAWNNAYTDLQEAIAFTQFTHKRTHIFPFFSSTKMWSTVIHI